MRNQQQRKLWIFALAIVLMLFVSSCATRVTMRYLLPAEIQLADYKNLAVLSIEPYRFSAFSTPSSVIQDLSGTAPYRVFSGFGRYTSREIASYMTNRVVRDLSNTNYFTLLLPPTSDDIGTRLQRYNEMGYDAILQGRVTDLDVDEYIYAKEETEVVPSEVEGQEPTIQTVLRHYVMQKVAFSVEFEIIDTSNGSTVGYRIFSDAREQSYKLDPSITNAVTAPTIYDWLTPMANEFSSSFTNMIAPRWVTESVALMQNKPNNRRAEQAYTYAKDGNLQYALDTFLAEWNRSSHVPSGYNAAIILESFGDVEKALQLINEVWRMSGNKTVERRKIAMQLSWEAHQKAQQQL